MGNTREDRGIQSFSPLDKHIKRGVVGASLAISMPGEEMALFTSGLADKFKKIPMRSDHTFRIASCTKTFVATGLHLLVEEGKVDFEEPITRWFPDMPKADTDAGSHPAQPSQRPSRFRNLHADDFGQGVEGGGDRGFAFKHGVQKEPWHGMEYSNTGYVLAGIIIARETGKPIPTICATASSSHWGCAIPGSARMRISRSSGKRAATCMSIRTASRNGTYSGAGDPVDGVWDSTEWFPMSGANAAGDMVSTPQDVVTFLIALFDGKILGPKQLGGDEGQSETGEFPGSKVVANGHGLLVSRYGDIDVKGHLGQIPGHSSLMGRDEKTGVTAMLIQNSGAADFESFSMASTNLSARFSMPHATRSDRS